MDRPDEPPERGLRDHVGVLRRRAVLIVVITVVAVGAALVYSLAQPTKYHASSTVLFQQEPDSVQDPQVDQLVDTKRLDANRVMQNQVRVATSQDVRDRTREAVGAPVSASARNVRDSDLIVITSTAGDAARAAEVANAWTQSYVDVSREQLTQRSSASRDAIDGQLRTIDARVAEIDSALGAPGTTATATAQLSGEREALATQRDSWVRQRSLVEADAALAAQNQVTILDPASAPSSPAQPALWRNAILALVLGLGLALVVAYAVDQLDDVIRTADDLERATGLPTVAIVPGDDPRDVVRTLPITDPLLRRDDALRPVGPAALDAPESARVLVVPRRSHGRRVGQDLALARRIGATVVGAVLVTPAGSTPAGAPTPSSPEPHEVVPDRVPR